MVPSPRRPSGVSAGVASEEAALVWKWLAALFLVLTLGCVGTGYWAVSSGTLKELREKLDPGAKPMEVRVGSPTRGTLSRTISAPGPIEAKTRVEISAQVSARIVALLGREGQEVKKGEVLVRLDAEDLAAAVVSAKASLRGQEARLAGAEAALTTARLDLNRKRELHSTKDVSDAVLQASEAEYLRAQSQYMQVQHDIEIAKANITRAEKDLQNTIITAPFDGVVTKLNAEVGELVVIGTLNNPSSIIMEVSDLNVMIMKARIDESNIAPVRPGQKARVYINALPDRSFPGVVERVRPTREIDTDGTAYFETEILVDVPDDFRLTGMMANADVEVEVLTDVLKVPSQAVVDRALDDLPAELVRTSETLDRNKKFASIVYRVVNGKAVPTPVIVGSSDLTDTVIVKGLSEDDLIVTGPYKSLVALKGEQAVRVDNGQPTAPAATAAGTGRDGAAGGATAQGAPTRAGG